MHIYWWLVHLSTDAGKELTEKIGLVYQINVAPKKLRHDYRNWILFKSKWMLLSPSKMMTLSKLLLAR
ncbi:unnamed protein product [Brassica oleracea]